VLVKDSPGLSEFLVLLFFAIPVLVFFRMFWLYWTRGRDPERDSASVQYGPPDYLTPGECGATAFRVEKKWTQAFGGVTVPAPQWYRSKYGGDFFPVHLVDDLNAMSNQAGSALTSKPSCSP
jgi:hypothetical protein